MDYFSDTLFIVLHKVISKWQELFHKKNVKGFGRNMRESVNERINIFGKLIFEGFGGFVDLK